MRAAARARGAITLKQNAQAVKRQQIVNGGDIARVFGYHARQSSGGDHGARLALRAKLGKKALEHAVHESDEAVIETALQMRNRVGADYFGRPPNIDSA